MINIEWIKKEELTESQLQTISLLVKSGAEKSELVQKINSLTIFRGVIAAGHGRVAIRKGKKIIAML